MYAAAAQMGLSMFMAGQQAKATQQAELEAMKISGQQRTIAFNRETQAYSQTLQSLKDQSTADNFDISIAQAQAQDKLAMQTAGSGLSGASVDELDDEIQRAVSSDRIASQRNLDATKQNLDQERKMNNENRVFEASHIKATDHSGDILNAGLSAFGNSAFVEGGSFEKGLTKFFKKAKGG